MAQKRAQQERRGAKHEVEHLNEKKFTGPIYIPSPTPLLVPLRFSYSLPPQSGLRP
ncbi:uncharacterized protein BO96DRAFT_411894 [Aspergillus niger CBS 101883]|uniref:uncharacterized protein n=1 Tax=Aspergillus lacticoffeatus (strain CBS 101883) TaxID=1450533 RepID=UPI000D801163|nr:uncharacterized protein BO96DRAFT_411894 [Aspergillus niger CBS 101883]PYH56883.1 hypothetical protein BO96DRAFT_411894 [Aspergillus niger CBS 101883]